jgi:hypothetical protein
MKNMKIKSYTFKKNSTISKEQNDYNSNSKSPTGNNNLNNNNILNDVEKILKSPGLNISLSKLDEKGKF